MPSSNDINLSSIRSPGTHFLISSQIPQCTSPISHNAPFCNRNVHMCAHFCYKMMHYGIMGYLSNALWDLRDGSIHFSNNPLVTHHKFHLKIIFLIYFFSGASEFIFIDSLIVVNTTFKDMHIKLSTLNAFYVPCFVKHLCWCFTFSDLNKLFSSHNVQLYFFDYKSLNTPPCYGQLELSPPNAMTCPEFARLSKWMV